MADVESAANPTPLFAGRWFFQSRQSTFTLNNTVPVSDGFKAPVNLYDTVPALVLVPFSTGVDEHATVALAGAGFAGVVIWQAVKPAGVVPAAALTNVV